MHILKATLTYGGFRSEAVYNGLDAVGLLRRSVYGAILVDLKLPDVHGIHLVKMIREITDVPIIIVSGEDAQEHKIGALDAGADDFITKPFLPGELLARIRAALRRGSAEEADESGAGHTRGAVA